MATEKQNLKTDLMKSTPDLSPKQISPHQHKIENKKSNKEFKKLTLKTTIDRTAEEYIPQRIIQKNKRKHYRHQKYAYLEILSIWIERVSKITLLENFYWIAVI